MVLTYGVNSVDINNLSYGYETTIKLPFITSELGNGNISIRDYGITYDSYSCKGKLYLETDDATDFHEFITETARGQVITISDCAGFYPFGHHIYKSTYTVLITIVDEGQVDVLARVNEFDVTMYNTGTLVYTNPVVFCKDGHLNFMGLTDLQYPPDGFNIDNTTSIFPIRTSGDTMYGVYYDYSKEKNISSFDMKLNEQAAKYFLYNFTNVYRGTSIAISGTNDYFIYGLPAGDGSFNGRFNGDELKIKHSDYDSVNIDFELVRV